MGGPQEAKGEEGYRPRAHDHLVEPFFAGLGHGPGGEEEDPAEGEEPVPEEPPPRGLLARLRRALGLRRSPRGPASRPEGGR